MQETFHGTCVSASDGRHSHDLPVDELDSVILAKDAGHSHPLVLGHGE
jgi:hypothetical protein